MFYKYNNVTGKTLTIKLNESNLFEMKTREIVEEKQLLENVDINKTLRTLYNSTNKYIAGNMSKRGFTGTVNLYSKKFNELVSAELPKIIRNETIKNLKPSKESVILELISWII